VYQNSISTSVQGWLAVAPAVGIPAKAARSATSGALTGPRATVSCGPGTGAAPNEAPAAVQVGSLFLSFAPDSFVVLLFFRYSDDKILSVRCDRSGRGGTALSPVRHVSRKNISISQYSILDIVMNTM